MAQSLCTKAERPNFFALPHFRANSSAAQQEFMRKC
jgi:hypothetical protein